MTRSVNCITINTDASYHPDYKIGGYAFYIVCDLFKIQKGGKFKTQPKSSQQAEMMCMANALATLLIQKELPNAKWIIINSDCLCAFEKIKLKSQDHIGKKVAQILRQIRKATDMPQFKFRHVKAHSGVDNARSWVNEWCDNEAKKWMRKQLPQLEKL